MALQNDVGPNLVADDHDVVLLKQLHGLFQLPALPHTAAGVVGGAEHRGVDVVLHDLLLHVREVHAVDARLVLDQGAVDNVVAVVGQAAGKADVGGGVEQHVVAFGAQHVQGADNAAQHAVFIANALLGQAGDAVALLLPVDDGVVVIVAGGKVAEERMLDALGNGLGDGGHRGEVHVRHPHGDDVKALFGGLGAVPAGDKPVHGDGVFPVPVDDAGKIVFHSRSWHAARVCLLLKMMCGPKFPFILHTFWIGCQSQIAARPAGGWLIPAPGPESRGWARPGGIPPGSPRPPPAG